MPLHITKPKSIHSCAENSPVFQFLAFALGDVAYVALNNFDPLTLYALDTNSMSKFIFVSRGKLVVTNVIELIATPNRPSCWH